ncbi:S8 family serine peptidase [Rufibacter immobilis]|uniref:S8 family serine peptidase n=1 Tax=Rufibacter immobilis TaxID=1348778 RepID=UPI0035E83973
MASTYPAAGQGGRIIAPKAVSKLAPALQHASERQSGQSVRVRVKNTFAFQNWLKETMPQVRMQQAQASDTTILLSNLEVRQIAQLAGCPWVVFVDVPTRVPQEEAHLQNADLTVNKVEAVHLRYPQLAGQNLVVSVKENPFDSTDIDFKGRVVSVKAAAPPTPHATSMATLVAGGGNTSPSGRGVAWQSHLITSDFARLMPDETAWLRSQKVSVQNHSYGVGLENYYGLESQAYDAQILEYPELLHVFSSGNAGTQTAKEGPYADVSGFANLTGQFKVSKNTLSVGAVDTSGQVSALSSRGPTYDGRIKPEVVAFGESGSSEASAVVSGVALLLQQVYQEQHNGTLPAASLVKAAIINSATEQGRPEVDYEAGFGNVDALGAVQAVQDKQYFTGSVAQGESRRFTIAVPAGMAKLKVTLVWHEPAGDPTAAAALVNDLDLTLQTTATGQKWLPWGLSSFPHPDSLLLPARRQVDRINNVEQVSLMSPGQGEYQMQVTGHKISTGSQSFSLVYGFEEAFSWAYPSKNSQIKSNEVNKVRWQTSMGNATSTRVEYRWAGREWQSIKNDVPVQQQFLHWRAPDSTGVAQLRIVTSSGQTFLTDEFLISPVLPLQVGYQCGDEFMLYWPKAKGSNQYQLYALGEKYLEPVAQVADTLVVLRKQAHPALHYAVAPLVAGRTGNRSLTINYSEQGVECFIKQFLARQLVSDTVVLEVELSTLHGVASVFLERREKDGFQVVKALTPLEQTSLVVTDAAPVPGKNEYRLKVTTEKGEVFYSALETVFYAPQSYVQVFPNPAMAGNEVHVVTLDDEMARIHILDYTGRILREVQQNGAMKSVTIKGLSAGIYVLRVYHKNGSNKLCRLVVI